MAIDSHDKRRSALGHGLPHMAVMPVADGTIDDADRPHVMGLYHRAAGAIAPSESRKQRNFLLRVYQP